MVVRAKVIFLIVIQLQNANVVIIWAFPNSAPLDRPITRNKPQSALYVSGEMKNSKVELRMYLNKKLLKLLLLLPVVAGSVSCGSGNSGFSEWPEPLIGCYGSSGE